ncbi:MAG TPA: peptidoglycan DD-metalloendopeptidase family protein, partial [Propionibacteriaceae bacterium]|nr:peptidoglycan DD-metalloendopeptidase family protein [Propionibacteriaceae bacterium]
MLVSRRLVPLLLAGLTLGLLLGGVPAVVATAQPRLPSPAGWPLAGTPEVIRGFAAPEHDYGPGHRGVDLAARAGEPVLAAAAGMVAYAGSVGGRGVVSIDHDDTRTTYEPVSPQV